MAVDLQLQIQGDTTNFTFDVGTFFLPEVSLEYSDTADPPELETITERWTIEGEMLAATPEATMDAWLAFLARLETRGSSFPVWARLVRGATTERTLGRSSALSSAGDTDYFRFRVVSCDFPTSEANPAAQWRTRVPVRMVLEAVRVFPDSSGIVRWRQSTTTRYVNGLAEVELRTEIETRPGVDATTKAGLYGVIDRDAYGTTYLWQTNGGDGCDVEALDTDERTGATWVPTKAVASSRIRQYGIDVGSTDPGAAPDDISYSIEDFEDDEKVQHTVKASAQGPGAFAWCLSKRPSGPISIKREQYDDARLTAECEWTQLKKRSKGADWQIAVTITGGHPDEEAVPMPGGRLPQLVVGPIRAFEAEVDIEVTVVGERPRAGEPLLPPLLPAPWRLQRNRSTCSPVASLEPGDKGADQASSRWTRKARLVYTSLAATDATAFDVLWDRAQGVEQYHL